MTMKRITLRLARNPGYPEGDRQQGYVIIAPLDPGGHLMVDEWRAHRSACTVVRFHPDPAEHADGWLTHRGSHWFFRYDEDHEGPDEPVYRFGDHRFEIGEYVTISHADGEALTYQVADVTSVNA